MAKKHYLVMARKPDVMKDGLDIDGKHINFHGKSGKMIHDDGIADAIDQKYGLKGSRDVWIDRDENSSNFLNYHDGIHSFFFGPTRAFSDAWARIFGDKDADNKRL